MMRNNGRLSRRLKKTAVLFSVCAALLTCVFVAPAAAAGPALYIVSADIVAMTGTPGFVYEKGDGFIEGAEGLKEALLYG
jgi:hypothetical protein